MVWWISFLVFFIVANRPGFPWIVPEIILLFPVSRKLNECAAPACQLTSFPDTEDVSTSPLIIVFESCECQFGCYFAFGGDQRYVNMHCGYFIFFSPKIISSSGGNAMPAILVLYYFPKLSVQGKYLKSWEFGNYVQGINGFRWASLLFLFCSFLLTLGEHARSEGYCSCCVYVCLFVVFCHHEHLDPEI